VAALALRGRRRRVSLTLLAALALGALAAASAAVAQPAAPIRIGVLQPGTPASGAHLFDAFKQAMREQGYVEGQHVVFEHRFGNLTPERMSAVAAELVRLNVALIVTSTDLGIAAAKQRTRTIPIVMVGASDPVETGFVASLASPGANITGLSYMSRELSGKRVELLKEVVPGLSRLAIIWNPDVRGAVLDYRETLGAARALRLQPHAVEVSRDADLDGAFAATTSGRAEALIVISPSPIAFANRTRIASFARTARLPSMYGNREFVDAGGLIAYGARPESRWRRAATFVHRILQGARPGELPVEQPTTFELAINLKTASALGLAVPPPLLRRADYVIQ
jgi:putative ABC transport system substrate-binding protein